MALEAFCTQLSATNGYICMALCSRFILIYIVPMLLDNINSKITEGLCDSLDTNKTGYKVYFSYLVSLKDKTTW